MQIPDFFHTHNLNRMESGDRKVTEECCNTIMLVHMEGIRSVHGKQRWEQKRERGRVKMSGKKDFIHKENLLAHLSSLKTTHR